MRLGTISTILELKRRKDTLERLGKFDLGGVIERENTEEFTLGEVLVGLFHKLSDTRFTSRDRHDHLHDLNLGVWVTSFEVVTRLDQVSDKFTGTGRSKLGGILFVLDDCSLRVDGENHGTDFFSPVDGMRCTFKGNEKTSVAERSTSDEDSTSVEVEGEGELRGLGHGEGVSHTLVDKLALEKRLERVLGWDLSLVEDKLVSRGSGLVGNVRLDHSTANDRKSGVGSLGRHTLSDKRVEPLSGERVVFKLWLFEQLDEVLDGRSELSPNRQFFERNDHRLSRFGSFHTVGKDMTELRIGILVQTTCRGDREVTPDIRVGSEVELGQVTRRRLETGIGILTRDSTGNDVALGSGLSLLVDRLWVLPVKVDVGDSVRVHAIERSDVSDSMKGDTHGDLELNGGDVATTDHFRGGMFDLETRVELEEVERVVGVRVEVLDGTGRDVSYELG